MAKILVTEKVDESGLEILRKAGHTIVEADNNDEIIAKEMVDADAVIVRVVPLPAQLLATAKKLRHISKHGVGIDNIDRDYCREHNILVTITPDANGLSVAEHAFALMMTLAKKLKPVATQYAEKGNKEGFAVRNVYRCSELSGKTVGIIGFGKIGRRLAKMCGLGFDMKVLAYDPFVTEGPDYVQMVDMDTLLRQSDFISIHTVLMESTMHLINRESLAKMKPNAILINPSRGPMVDEPALIEALQKGVIGGAGLDVSDPEPMEAGNPLFGMENVIVTPHFAACTLEAAQRVSQIACQNVVDYLEGRQPVGIMK